MYEPIRLQFYAFVSGLIDLLMTESLWEIVGPFVVMSMILWLLRWAFAQSRGQRIEDVQTQVEANIEHYRRIRNGDMPPPARRRSRIQ